MSTITFDTLKFVQRLEKAGATRELVTKSDLKSEVTRLDNRLDILGKDIQAMEMRLTIKLGAFLAVAVGVMLTVLKMH